MGETLTVLSESLASQLLERCYEQGWGTTLAMWLAPVGSAI
jgi:hypothetical protein